jgi:hypothetical protein
MLLFEDEENSFLAVFYFNPDYNPDSTGRRALSPETKGRLSSRVPENCPGRF